MTRPLRAAATLLGAAALLGGGGEAALVRRRSRARAALDTYTFEDFVRDFGRDIAPGSAEYHRRAGQFEASLAQVRAVSARNQREGRLWKAGIHPFMDWTETERQRLNGYKPPAARGTSGRRAPRGALSLLHSGARAFNRNLENMTRGWETSLSDAFSAESGGLSMDDGPAVRNQGDCGSCWAISAVEAVEAQLLRAGTGGGARLAAQALIDCVPNPQHCGGSGGCDGATGELAYAYMRDHGIPFESQMKYTAMTQQCPQPTTGLWEAPLRVRVEGWVQLPSNKAGPLMQAITQSGPVVVAVDGNDWFNYESGVFDGCDKNAILGHAVLAKGYGKEGNAKYWLIQNSWGAEWGEQGHIRLLRHDDEDGWCGVDDKPKDGVGCDGGPSEVTVCGSCGLLYDPVMPTGVRLERADGVEAQAMTGGAALTDSDPSRALASLMGEA